jgi:hypothetical protein
MGHPFEGGLDLGSGDARYLFAETIGRKYTPHRLDSRAGGRISSAVDNLARSGHEPDRHPDVSFNQADGKGDVHTGNSLQRSFDAFTSTRYSIAVGS